MDFPRHLTKNYVYIIQNVISNTLQLTVRKIKIYFIEMSYEQNICT